MKTTPTTNKLIGILGGMGPGASANLYQRIITYAQHRYHAVQDFDYPPIVLFSLPLVGFTEEGITDEEQVKAQLTAGVKKLEKAGCELIIIACNTVHYFHAEMQAAVTTPILNMVDEVQKEVVAKGYGKVGLFCSDSTSRLGLYQKSFANTSTAVVGPDMAQQATLNRVIEHVMGGTQGLSDILALKDIAHDYAAAGAEALILGCTEIPLAINQSHTDIKLFDSLEIMTKLAVDFSLSRE